MNSEEDRTISSPQSLAPERWAKTPRMTSAPKLPRMEITVMTRGIRLDAIVGFFLMVADYTIFHCLICENLMRGKVCGFSCVSMGAAL